MRPGVVVAGDSPIGEDVSIEGPVWIGDSVTIGSGVRLTGPIVIGDGASVGDGAQLRGTILFPGTEVAPESILIGAIAGHGGHPREHALAPPLTRTGRLRRPVRSARAAAARALTR